MSKHYAYIVWGCPSTVQDNPDVAVYAFDTQQERDAFLYGVDEASGYLEYESFDSEEEAEAYIKDVIGAGDLDEDETPEAT